MKNIIKFLSFILYSTCTFFIPNSNAIFIFIFTNFLIVILCKMSIRKVIKSTLKIFPFILFTFVVNCLLEEITYSIWISIKLIIVCNITIIYSNTVTIVRSCRNNKIIMHAVKNIQY